MGIRYLTKIYSPLGEFVNYDKLKHAACFIDGPSLAHCICSDLPPNSVGDTALATEKARRVLQAFVDKGIDIQYVVFDGAMPLEKAETKFMRANQDIAKLQDAPSGLTLGSFAADMLRETLDEYFPSIPVITVPYEADYAVAGMVNRFAAMIKQDLEVAEDESRPKRNENVYLISSDSDFLVYDLGSNVGCICFTRTKDIETGDKVFVTYHKKIMDTVRMPLWEAGYVLESIPFWKRKNLVISDLSRSKIDKKNPRYHEFKDEFTLKDFYWNSFEDFVKDSRILFMKTYLPKCRFSRLHIMLNRHGDNLRAKLTKRHIDIYLPMLVEDINKPTVWAIGQAWRSLAYELMLKKFEEGMIKTGELAEYTKPDIIIEYRREGLKLGACRMPINDDNRKLCSKPNDEPSAESIKTLEEMKSPDFLKLMTSQVVCSNEAGSYKDLGENLYKYFNLVFGLGEYEVSKPGKTDDLISLMSSLNIKDIHWSIKKLHLFAQVQALFYSLMFLQQAGVILPVHVKIRYLRASEFSMFF